MSSRSIRRLQGKDVLEKYNAESDEEHSARIKVMSKYSFGLLCNESESSDEEAQEEEIEQLVGALDSGCKKRRKKKKSHERKTKLENGSQKDKLNDKLEYHVLQPNIPLMTNSCNSYERPRNSSLLHISMNNLNMNYELKKIFGPGIIENNPKRRTHGRLFRLINPRESWPPMYRTGISMTLENTDSVHKFSFVHSRNYQHIQHKFLDAVDSLNPDNIIAILNEHPYHVDALIQLSDLCKLSEDLQVAAELNERALYCLENAFHHQFNFTHGNCRLDYRYQVNRSFFICVFKHLIFVGEKACYKTALELCKLLLLLDFESDPLGVVLCIDFYALRSRNYQWLIRVAEEWESTKSLSQLPNFAFSTALANFYLAKAGNTNSMTVADRSLQDALILFPAALKPLLDKCSIHCDKLFHHQFFSTESFEMQTNALKVLISLYINRTYHEWKNREVLSWLEKNVHVVLQRVDSLDPFVEESAYRRKTRYSGCPKNILRHIVLSDMKDVTSIVGDINGPSLSFDPLPPSDSIDIYHRQNITRITELSPSLTLFFRSILPSFNLNSEDIGYVANNAVADNRVNEQAQQQAPPFQETFQNRVTMLMDAVVSLLSNVQAHGAETEDGNTTQNTDELQVIEDSEGQRTNQNTSDPDDSACLYRNTTFENDPPGN